MQGIKELILLLQQHNLRPLQQSANDTNYSAALLRLFEGVSAGHYCTDADAVADLFPPGTGADHSGFFELKSTLREKLIDSIHQFHEALAQYSDTQKAHIECQKNWLNIRCLSGRNAGDLAISLARQLLQIAEKFDLTPLCMDISLYLRIQCCLHGQNTALCTAAEQKYQYFRNLYDVEFQAEKSYSALMSQVTCQLHSREEVLSLATKASVELQPVLSTLQSPKLHMYAYLIDLVRHTAAREYAQAMITCEQAIHFFKSRPYQARDPLQVFYYQQLVFSIYLKQYETGRQSALACLEMANEDPFNRFKIKELHLLLALHTREYEAAVRMFFEVKTDPQFDFLPPFYREAWTLYESYLYFLQHAAALDIPPGRIAPADSQTDVSVAGETCLTTARMVIRFLLLLQQKRYGEMLEMVEEMDEYAQNNLENERTRRSYLFLKMLIQIPTGHFQRHLILQMASRLVEKIKTTPLALANQIEEIEILPYEDLWSLALASLNGDKIFANQ